MKAHVKRDDTTRQIAIAVEGAPDLDITTYHRTSRLIRPDSVSFSAVNGKVSSISVSGPLVLKSGKVSSTVRDSFRDYGDKYLMPSWVMPLVTEAVAGVTGWDDESQASPDESQGARRSREWIGQGRYS